MKMVKYGETCKVTSALNKFLIYILFFKSEINLR